MQFIFALLATSIAAVSAAPHGYDHHPANTISNYTAETNYQPKTIKVIVGGPNDLTYKPPFVTANAHDIIEFEFRELNHTATESDFATPCVSNGRFDTGFVPNLENVPGIVRSYVVPDEKPHWFYCRQGNHCGMGMVFAVNPPKKGKTFEAFREKAIEDFGMMNMD